MSWVCLSCLRWGGGSLCGACATTLAPAAEARLESGLVVRPAFRHDGAARRLVHRLKYRGERAAASVLAVAMARRLPPGAAAVVPVPRARLRRWRHGVDPARELARELQCVTGLPVIGAVRAGWWWPPHAGRDRAGRSCPPFSCAGEVAGAVLVDDVLTTGSTLAAAGAAIGGGVIGAVTATAARPTALTRGAADGYSDDEPLAG